MRTIPLAAGPNPPAFFHLASESPAALGLAPEVVELYSRMVREGGALFGTCRYSEFHFLITCSDELGHLGLEHLSSSLNGVRERNLMMIVSARWIVPGDQPRCCPPRVAAGYSTS
jgi:hypothetical protein